MRRRVADARVGRLATIDDQGHPTVVPFCFAIDGDTLYSAVDDVKPKSTMHLKRLANIAARPDVAVIVDHYDDADWSRLWWVKLSGRARVVQGGDEARRAIALLADKYPQYRDAPPPGPVLAVELARWLGWP